EVAAEAAWVPRRMTRDAAHPGIVVRVGAITAGRRIAPDHPVAIEPDGLGEVGAPVVVRRIRVDRVDDLSDLPGQVGLDHRALDDGIPPLLEPALPERRPQDLEVPSPLAGLLRGGIRCGAGRDEVGPLRGRAVAVDALDLDGRADLAVKLGVAVHVLDEVTVD